MAVNVRFDFDSASLNRMIRRNAEGWAKSVDYTIRDMATRGPTIIARNAADDYNIAKTRLNPRNKKAHGKVSVSGGMKDLTFTYVGPPTPVRDFKSALSPTRYPGQRPYIVAAQYLRDRPTVLGHWNPPGTEGGKYSAKSPRMYLGGKFGTHPSDVNAYAASTFYAVDRYASFKTDWGGFYQGGGVVVADRYTTSNAVHQCSKLPPEAWPDYLVWLFDFEYRYMGIPAPDGVVYLQVDPAVSQRLMTGRYQGDESKKDIHEKDREYLARSRRAAEYCAARLGWHTVPCCQGEEMRPIPAIQQDVRNAVEALL